MTKTVDVYKFQIGLDSYVSYDGFTEEDARSHAAMYHNSVGACIGKNIKCKCGGEFSLPKKQSGKSICSNHECAGIKE